MERHEIDTLLALAEELHFSRTAQRLRLTTGQVSKTIKKLERRVGAPLFERSSRVVRVTPIGRQLIDDLKPLVAGLDDALTRAIDAGRGITGTLVAGYIGAQNEQLLLRTVRLFSARHPDCEVVIHHEIKSRPRLFRGDVDVVFAAFPYPDAERGPTLMSEARVLAVPIGHPLEGEESVSMEVLADYPLIQLSPDGPAEFRKDRTPSHTPSGREVRKGPVISSLDEMLSLVALGRGVYIVGEHHPRYYTRPDVAYVPIRDVPTIDRGVVWLETNATARVRAFVKAATDAHRADAKPDGPVGED